MSGSEYSIRKKLLQQKILVGISLLGVTSVIFGAWLGLYKEEPWKVIASTTIVSIGGSVVAASIVALFIMYYRNLGLQKERKQFYQLIGITSPNDRVAIILPRFLNGCDICSESVVETKNSRSNALKDIRDTNRYCLAFDDIVAVRHMTSIFVKLELKPPRIEFDDTIYDFLFGDKKNKKQEMYSQEIYEKFKTFKSFISIGLFSSDVTMGINGHNNASYQRCFELAHDNSGGVLKRKVRLCPQQELDLSKWMNEEEKNWQQQVDIELEEPMKKNGKAFCLIAKCRTPENATCLIIGGARSRGTRKIASHFRDHWKSIFDRYDNLGKEQIKDKSFAELYTLQGVKDERPEPFLTKILL